MLIKYEDDKQKIDNSIGVDGQAYHWEINEIYDVISKPIELYGGEFSGAVRNLLNEKIETIATSIINIRSLGLKDTYDFIIRIKYLSIDNVSNYKIDVGFGERDIYFGDRLITYSDIVEDTTLIYSSLDDVFYVVKGSFDLNEYSNNKPTYQRKTIIKHTNKFEVANMSTYEDVNFNKTVKFVLPNFNSNGLTYMLCKLLFVPTKGQSYAVSEVDKGLFGVLTLFVKNDNGLITVKHDNNISNHKEYSSGYRPIGGLDMSIEEESGNTVVYIRSELYGAYKCSLNDFSIYNNTLTYEDVVNSIQSMGLFKTDYNPANKTSLINKTRLSQVYNVYQPYGMTYGNECNNFLSLFNVSSLFTTNGNIYLQKNSNIPVFNPYGEDTVEYSQNLIGKQFVIDGSLTSIYEDGDILNKQLIMKDGVIEHSFDRNNIESDLTYILGENDLTKTIEYNNVDKLTTKKNEIITIRDSLVDIKTLLPKYGAIPAFELESSFDENDSTVIITKEYMNSRCQVRTNEMKNDVSKLAGNTHKETYGYLSSYSSDVDSQRVYRALYESIPGITSSGDVLVETTYKDDYVVRQFAYCLGDDKGYVRLSKNINNERVYSNWVNLNIFQEITTDINYARDNFQLYKHTDGHVYKEIIDPRDVTKRLVVRETADPEEFCDPILTSHGSCMNVSIGTSTYTTHWSANTLGPFKDNFYGIYDINKSYSSFINGIADTGMTLKLNPWSKNDDTAVRYHKMSWDGVAYVKTSHVSGKDVVASKNIGKFGLEVQDNVDYSSQFNWRTKDSFKTIPTSLQDNVILSTDNYTLNLDISESVADSGYNMTTLRICGYSQNDDDNLILYGKAASQVHNKVLTTSYLGSPDVLGNAYISSIKTNGCRASSLITSDGIHVNSDSTIYRHNGYTGFALSKNETIDGSSMYTLPASRTGVTPSTETFSSLKTGLANILILTNGETYIYGIRAEAAQEDVVKTDIPESKTEDYNTAVAGSYLFNNASHIIGDLHDRGYIYRDTNGSVKVEYNWKYSDVGDVVTETQCLGILGSFVVPEIGTDVETTTSMLGVDDSGTRFSNVNRAGIISSYDDEVKAGENSGQTVLITENGYVYSTGCTINRQVVGEDFNGYTQFYSGNLDGYTVGDYDSTYGFYKHYNSPSYNKPRGINKAIEKKYKVCGIHPRFITECP